MQQQGDDLERSVRSLLESRRFECCPEPQWITDGKRPDFFCTGPAEIWVEVKSLGITPPEKKALEVHSWFDKRRSINRPGARISAFYAPDVIEKDFKEALIRVRALLDRSNLACYNRLVVTIPRDPDYKCNSELVVSVNNRDTLIVCARSKSGCYGCVGTTLDIHSEQSVTMREAGRERSVTAGQLGLDEEHLKIALLVTPWSCHELSLAGGMEVRSAVVGWPDSKRFLHDAGNAAKKFKNALKYKLAPSIIIYVSDFDSPESCVIRIESLKSVLYGTHTLVWQSTCPENDEASVIHGQGAFWTNKKNTSVSAACYVSRGDPICVLHNPWANEPLPTGLIGCPEYRGLDSGKIENVC